MSDWLHNLPVPWMALVIFGFTYLLAALLYAAVTALSVGHRAKSSMRSLHWDSRLGIVDRRP